MMERMTIQEAIEHAKKVSEQKYAEGMLCHANPDDGMLDECIECGRQHEQIASWLEELKAYKDLEEQGLLLKLPCKVGDTVWCIFEGKVYKAIVRKVAIITGSNNYQLVKIEAEFWIIDPFYNDGRVRKYGVYQNYLETVFLTKAEAEEALKKMESEHE